MKKFLRVLLAFFMLGMLTDAMAGRQSYDSGSGSSEPSNGGGNRSRCGDCG